MFRKNFVSVMEYAEFLLLEGKKLWFENNKSFENKVRKQAVAIAETITDDLETRALIERGIYQFETYSKLYKGSL